MKRLTWPAALAVVWIGTIGAADAADRSNKFAMKGAGLVTCENYLKARAEKLPSYPNFAGWTMGYITAINQRGFETFDVAPWQSIEILMTLLEAFCKRNLEQRFGLAVMALTNSLLKGRISENSPVVTTGEADQKVSQARWPLPRGAIRSMTRAYQAVLRKIQLALAERGHYQGATDGAWSDATRTAIEAFQNAENISATGLPDQRTLYQLFIDELR